MLQRVAFYTLIGLLTACNPKKQTPPSPYEWQCLAVTATAYNSLAYQTNSQPNIGAFGDTLKPGMKCIAVSRDLLKLGLTHNTPVTIDGFDGVYLVKDKMHWRWRKRIDIYMGTDVKAAKTWGKQKLEIGFQVLKDTTTALKKASK